MTRVSSSNTSAMMDRISPIIAIALREVERHPMAERTLPTMERGIPISHPNKMSTGLPRKKVTHVVRLMMPRTRPASAKPLPRSGIVAAILYTGYGLTGGYAGCGT